MNSWKMKLSRISCKSCVHSLSLSLFLLGRIVGFYIFHVVYLCTDLLGLPLFVLGFRILAPLVQVDITSVLAVRSFFSFARASSRFLSLHSNLIVFFFSLRYAWSTTLNYRKLHIFSLFLYWMVSVMSLLFPFRSILCSFFGIPLAAPPNPVCSDMAWTEFCMCIQFQELFLFFFCRIYFLFEF